MATKQVKRYEVLIALSDNDGEIVKDARAAATFWVPEASARGGISVEISGDEVDSLLASVKSAVEEKLAEDGSTVEGL